MSNKKLPFEEFIKLSSKQRGVAYKYLSDSDKFKVRITSLIGESDTPEEQRKAILMKYNIKVE